MAIQTIKEVINNKGYLIDSKDRQIFETGDLRSFFGLSVNDSLEFIVYDANDNQLPQSDGKLVRYIPLSTDNIRDYLLIPDGTIFQRYQLPKEYFVDVERLLREAGYDNGIFKTQITLVNKRVGSEYPTDKLWISEISPSRTEVRLFPLKKNQRPEILQNLQQRFDLFRRGGNFREDIINDAFSYVEKINPSTIGSYIKAAYGERWFSSFVDEYKISDFDKFITNVHNKFLEGCIFEFTDRISDIGDINYGKPKNTQSTLSLDINILKLTIQKILAKSLNFYLLEPDVTSNTQLDIQKQTTLDEIDNILISAQSDILIKSEVPVLNKVTFKKPEQNLIKIELDKLIQDVIIDVDVPIKVVTPIDEPDYTPIETPVYTPIETPIYSGGGRSGGGTTIQRDFGTGFGREQVFETSLNDRQNLL